ncbi:hypothetical protein TYRP_012536 [Tyrophagus putrescentiae]|nr:hypothetical protein TYRP_012536 [Tyrophagus putrescentiae]
MIYCISGDGRLGSRPTGPAAACGVSATCPSADDPPPTAAAACIGPPASPMMPIHPLSSSSDMRMLTRAYSISEAKTKTVQLDMKMSIALMYDTGGSDFCDWAC